MSGALQLAREASRSARSLGAEEGGGVTEEDIAERREVQRLFREKLIEPLAQRHGVAYIESAFVYDAATSSWNFRALQSLSNTTDRYRSFEVGSRVGASGQSALSSEREAAVAYYLSSTTAIATAIARSRGEPARMACPYGDDLAGL